MSLTFGSLFAGIGGFDLGFERAGLTCKWQVEIDPYCQKVLAKHWPNVPRHDDVRTFPPAGDWNVDVICGGFPCQDISAAGRRVGIGGERSGLWGDMCRIIRVLRPRFAVVENVAALLDRGMGRVLGDLASIGYDAEWACIPALAVGAPHIRDRVWICAYPNGERLQGRQERHGETEAGQQAPQRGNAGRLCDHAPDAPGLFSGQRRREQLEAYGESCRGLFWSEAESGIQRVVDGVPDRVDRLVSLGNAVVPQVAEWIGRRLIETGA